jgi:hypothetical protein
VVQFYATEGSRADLSQRLALSFTAGDADFNYVLLSLECLLLLCSSSLWFLEVQIGHTSSVRQTSHPLLNPEVALR